jgi:hypothetical protein
MDIDAVAPQKLPSKSGFSLQAGPPYLICDYGDYKHGAFWFDLEPAAVNFARNADGNSRIQIALSTPATAEVQNAVGKSRH